ncbi:NAD(P)/FAD-dependent oxidoreductase [Aquimarina sp. BL5]|uniref:NAD(P)/FAD-dependent oxidoreductase n=1 Tax=Aquimarina sp. BL5 TaxID=1714860 RepID=UPI000E5015B5|nr:NAD(P)/FAD-dependent oxidoreductase [Aquimarina sp. BL5]AXT53866.1 NAD(P)/FAD-dependent oxidoreductase [Aquimarina sp. BL5]RKN04665.1 FAD-dependent oxidoreductase [Aquimarina sp. BL5]
MKKENVDVLVIGAGPSGSVSAAYLNKQGVNVKVVEKTKFPRFQVGESLIPRCMDNFKEAGLLDCLMKQGYEKKHGARFIKDGVHGCFDFSKKYGEGWNWTWQVPRDHFDKTLIDEAIKQGVSVDFETEVTNVEFNGTDSLTTVKHKDGSESEIEAKFIIDSSGFGRVIARQLGLEAAPKIAEHGSIFTQVKDINRPEGTEGTLITFEIIETEVWFWYIPFSNGNTSIGFVGPMEWINKFKGNTTEVLEEMMKTSPYYYKQFKDLPYLFDPYKVENISKNVTKLFGDGFVLTGNSAEFLDPVFSSGVSFATETGLLAAKLAVKQLNSQEVDWQVDFVDYIKDGVEVFSTYVKEWYTGNLQKIIFHKNENPVFKEQICAVLAGYVWDKTNPFVKKHKHILRSVAKLVEMEESMS